jgi:hypothetical protein
MNTILLPTKLSLASIVLFMLSIFTSPGMADDNQQCKWVAVDQNSFAEILTMINSRVEENYNRIKTWQGKIKIVANSINEGEGRKEKYEQILVDKPLPNKIIDHVELTKEFAMDADKGLLYESIYPDAQQNIIDAQTGRNLQLSEFVQIGSGKNILTPNYQLDCRDIKNRDGAVVRRDVIKQVRPQGKMTCQEHLRPIFDPRDTMRIFGDITGKSSAPLGRAFAKYLGFFDKEEGHSIAGHPTITVEECNTGDVKKYRIALIGLSRDDTGAIVHSYSNLVCSSEAGFSVVSFSITDEKGIVFENKIWDYDLINGVYLPVQKIEQNFDYPSGKLNKQSTVTFMEQKANNPINSDVFTYKNLGLKDGDKFIDKTLNKEFIYQKGNLIAAEKKSK